MALKFARSPADTECRPSPNNTISYAPLPRASNRQSAFRCLRLETLAVIAYKQPVTVPEISEIRGVDSSGVIATLLDRKLITTGGRKAVIGRPILYKTTKEFLMRFGLRDIGELPSMEEFEKLVAESFQSDLLPADSAPVDAPESVFANENTLPIADSVAVEHQESVLATVENERTDENDSAA